MRWLAFLVISTLSLTQTPAVDGRAIDALLDAGFAAQPTGQYPEMLRVGQDALQLSIAAHDDARRAKALLILGMAHSGQTHLPEALDELQQADAAAATVHVVGLHKKIDSALGNTLRLLSRSDEALAKYNAWRQLNRGLPHPEPEGRIIRAIGILYYEMSDVDKADAMLTEALAAARQAGDTLLQASVLLSKTAVEKTRGHFQQAIDFGNQALAIARQAGARSLEAELLNSMGSGYSQMGDHDHAAASYRAAIEIATSIGYRGVVVQATSRLGEVEMAREHYADAIELFRASTTANAALADMPYKQWTVDLAWAQAESALGHIDESVAHYRETMRMIEQMERGAVPTELARALPISTRRDVFEEAAGVEYDAGRTADALETADRSRARAFLDVLRESRLDPRPPELATVAAIQRELLDPDTVLIEYLLSEKRSWAWAVTRDRVEVAALPGRAAIQALVTPERDALAEPVTTLTAAGSLRAAQAREQQLYRMLIAPLESALTHATHLLIVPDGALAYIPFDSLRAPGGYLLERFAITYAQSAAAHLALKRQIGSQVPPVRTFVAFGDPVYDRVVPRVEGTRADWAPIPGSRAEVLGIGLRYPSASRSLMLGEAATESAVKRENLAQYRYVHFAVHGFADEADPAKSGLALGRERGAGEDGMLHMDEIARLRLNADLVTLSACRTAAGKLLGGEGLLSLSRAFFYAGARHVVATLWNVNDRSTADLMMSFYAQLDKGLPVPDALRAAKLQMLRGPNRAWQHPHAWAAFVAMQ
jgi:CHAT domain-containing protein/tetratricopeptide (TPR) repeat protein